LPDAPARNSPSARADTGFNARNQARAWADSFTPRAGAGSGAAMTAARRLALMAVLTLAIIAGGVGLAWLLNPYGATSSRLVNPIFRKIKYDRLATPYLLRELRPETLLIGSSRVRMGMRIEQGERDGVMNAAILGATLPQLEKIINVALLNPRLKRIVWGVDFCIFNSTWNAADPYFDARIANSPRARIEDTLLSLNALGDGFDLLKRAWRGRARLAPTMVAPAPWPMALICREYAIDRDNGLDLTPAKLIALQLNETIHMYDPYRFSPAMTAGFRKTVAKIRAHHVELILFTPPMSEYELELIRQSGAWGDFEKFKRTIAAVAPFVDYGAYNPMAPRDELYLQVIHFKADAGFQMLRRLLGMPTAACDDDARAVEDSGIAVNAENIEDALARERRMRDEAVNAPNKYSLAAARAAAELRAEQAAEAKPAAGNGESAPRKALALPSALD
jgi:hypothetical protein